MPLPWSWLSCRQEARLLGAASSFALPVQGFPLPSGVSDVWSDGISSLAPSQIPLHKVCELGEPRVDEGSAAMGPLHRQPPTGTWDDALATASPNPSSLTLQPGDHDPS